MENRICCDVFRTLAREFDWYSLGEHQIVVPSIVKNGIHFRVNYCPSCGAYIRNITINRSEIYD